jgi:outer membrane lipoprotein SlyB
MQRWHRGDKLSLQRLVVGAAAAGWTAIAAAVACAASARAEALAVDGFTVEEVSQLAAGVPLNFSVYGTPGAAAMLRIEGGWRRIALSETEPGVYEGTYVIDRRDAIVPASRVSATLQRGGSIAEASLEGPLLLPRGPLPWADAAAATAAAPSTPPKPAAMPIPVFPLDAPPAPIAAPPREGPTPATVAPQRAACRDCAVVQSVRLVKEPPVGGAIGAIAGTIAGAILGQEIAEAHRQRMLGFLGAIGGALAGREIEREATRARHYEVVFRRADGSTQTRRYERMPPFAPGDSVRLDSAGGRDAPAAAPF